MGKNANVLNLQTAIHPSFRNSSKGNDQRDFPGGAVVKNLLANAGDTGPSSSLRRSHMPRSN